MWTLPKHQAIEIRQPTDAFRQFMNVMVSTAGDPDLDRGATAIIIMISEQRIPPLRNRPNAIDAATRRARIWNAITGDARADDGELLAAAELLVVRRIRRPVERIPGPSSGSRRPISYEPPPEVVRIYLRALWDTEERRGMIEVCRDDILAQPPDAPLSFTAQLLAAEALPFGHPLLVELILKERRMLAGDRS